MWTVVLSILVGLVSSLCLFRLLLRRALRRRLASPKTRLSTLTALNTSYNAAPKVESAEPLPAGKSRRRGLRHRNFSDEFLMADGGIDDGDLVKYRIVSKPVVGVRGVLKVKPADGAASGTVVLKECTQPDMAQSEDSDSSSFSPSVVKQVRLVEPSRAKLQLVNLREFWDAPGVYGETSGSGIAGYRRTRDLYINRTNSPVGKRAGKKSKASSDSGSASDSSDASGRRLRVDTADLSASDTSGGESPLIPGEDSEEEEDVEEDVENEEEGKNRTARLTPMRRRNPRRSSPTPGSLPHRTSSLVRTTASHGTSRSSASPSPSPSRKPSGETSPRAPSPATLAAHVASSATVRAPSPLGAGRRTPRWIPNKKTSSTGNGKPSSPLVGLFPEEVLEKAAAGAEDSDEYEDLSSGQSTPVKASNGGGGLAMTPVVRIVAPVEEESPPVPVAVVNGA